MNLSVRKTVDGVFEVLLLTHAFFSVPPLSGNSNAAIVNKSGLYNVEPSPFTATNHLLLDEHSDITSSRVDFVWHDGIGAGFMQDPDPNIGGPTNQEEGCYFGQWEFANPGRFMRKTKKSRQSSRDKSRDRNRFYNSKIPFHRKVDLIDDLAWTMGQTNMMCGGPTAGSAGGHSVGGNGGQQTGNGSGGPKSVGNMGPPGSVKDSNIFSPASVGSVLTPKAPAQSLLSPLPPPSNGPLTPMDNGGAADSKHLATAPHTPKSVPQYSGVASPFTNVKSVEPPGSVGKKMDQQPGSVKTESKEHLGDLVNSIKTESGTGGLMSASSSSEHQQSGNLICGGSLLNSSNVFMNSSGDHDKGPLYQHHRPPPPYKRPALPLKEYENELGKEGSLSDNVYDYKTMHHWLNHPVKRFKPSEPRSGDPLR